MKKYAQENVKIKISRQNWAYNLHFAFEIEIWIYVESFYYFLYSKIFKDWEKLS